MIIILEIISFLSKKRKKQLVFLFFTMISSGFAEIASLYSVFPLINIITSNSTEQDVNNLSTSFNIFSIVISKIGISNFSILFIFIILSTIFIRLFNILFNYKLAAKIAVDICDIALRKILNQKYLFFVEKNSAELISKLVLKSNMAVFSISLFFQMLTGLIVSTAIVVGLFTINYKVSMITGLFFASLYFGISFFSYKTLRNNGKVIAARSDLKIKVLQESIGGIRDLILDSNQYIFRKLFHDADNEVRTREANNQVIAFVPRYLLEGLAIISLVLSLVINSILNPNSVNGFLALAGTLALGVQRLLPAMQLVYSSWATIQTQKQGVIEILELLKLKDVSKNNSFVNIKPLSLKKSFELRNISYSYEKDVLILKNINLKISKGERIGIIGKTGSGKSTLLDICMGLLMPQKGEIYLDNKKISTENNNQLSWRKNISHVPQSIFLSDASITENISFGVEPSKINHIKVKKAAIAANLLKFIESKKEKFNTLIGERGIQLSGGQRQRIAIARAFYKGGDFLVLDEATSALDSNTENSIMESVMKLSDKKTILIVAHRLSTLRNCDRIYELIEGELIERDKNKIL